MQEQHDWRVLRAGLPVKNVQIVYVKLVVGDPAFCESVNSIRCDKDEERQQIFLYHTYLVAVSGSSFHKIMRTSR